MAAKQLQYSPRQIAKSLQVSESSVKRWCDQGVIPTVRTVGGHRRITMDGLRQFLQASGRSVLAPQILGLPSLRCAESVNIPGDSDPDREAFRDALARGDEPTCRRVLQGRISDGQTRSEAAEFLITDAMHGLGAAWDHNELDPYQERRACDICIRLINELRSELPLLPSNAPVAIGGTTSGDPYQLPTALVELALREVGWNATSLGSGLPMESYLQAVRDQDPQLLWLSVSAISNLAVFVAEQNRLAAQIGEDVSLIVGGRALTDDIRPQLSYTAHCDSLRHLIDLAAMLRLNAVG